MASRRLGNEVANYRQVLFIGDSTHGEFSAALSWLQGQGDVVLQDTVDAGLAWLESSNQQPSVIVLGVARRGEHESKGLAQVTRLVPLARAIALVGSWCEGETRSGKPPKGWRRIYWHQFGRWAAGELLAPNREDAGDWKLHPAHLPRTSTESERAFTWSRWSLPAGDGRVAVNTVRRVDYEALAKVCAVAEYDAIWCQDGDGDSIATVNCVLWDRRGLQGAELRELMHWRECWEELPVIATIGFPRPQDYRLVEQQVVQGIVGKPFVLPDLVFALKQAAAVSSSKGEAA